MSHVMRNYRGYTVCARCGACKRRSGFWYLVGMRSKTEPPCAISGDEYKEWRNNAKEYKLKWERDLDRRNAAIDRAREKFAAMTAKEKRELIQGIFLPVESIQEGSK